MKLTKNVVEVLKYHGYVTFTESAETFLKRFDTVEELGDAGFITDRGAIDFLKTVFDENGINRSVEVGEEELEKQATEEPIKYEDDAPLGEDNDGNLVHDLNTDAGVNEQGPSEEPEPTPEPEPEKVEEPVDAPEDKKAEEPTADEVKEETEAAKNKVEETEPTPEPEKTTEVVEKPKKTTAKKSTKKES